MANTIRLKKRAAGGVSGAPSSLAPSEPAFSEVDSILYYGFGDSGGSASSVIAIGGSGAFATLTGTQTISGDKSFTGTIDLSGATLSGTNTTFSNNLIVSGDLTVNGTTTTINTETVDVKDKNITLGDVTTPSDATADGGGLSLLGATTKTFNWVNSTDSWTASEHIDLASGKNFKVAGTSVLSGSTLGSGVTGSSLTSVGTLTSGTWSASTIATNKGGTGQTGYSNGQLLIGNSSGSLSKATLTAGSNITITEASGSITIAAAAAAPIAGDGIDVAGSTVSADLKTNGGLVFESTEIAVDLGASSITGTLAIADGGTGATTASAALSALGAQASDADLTTLSGMQSGAATALAALTSAEVAILDGAIVSTTELNYVDGVTSAIQTQLDSKQGSDAQLTTLAGMAAATATNLAALTSTEAGILDGATVTTAELNVLDGDGAPTFATLDGQDRFICNDSGTIVQVKLSNLVAFLENSSASGFELDGGTF